MLDLTGIEQELFEMKLVDGTVLTIKKPTHKLYIKLLDLQEMFKDTCADTKKLLDLIYQIATDVLNRNTQGIVFTLDRVKSDEFDLDILNIILEHYRVFCLKHASNPN